MPLGQFRVPLAHRNGHDRPVLAAPEAAQWFRQRVCAASVGQSRTIRNQGDCVARTLGPWLSRSGLIRPPRHRWQGDVVLSATALQKPPASA